MVVDLLKLIKKNCVLSIQGLSVKLKLHQSWIIDFLDNQERKI